VTATSFLSLPSSDNIGNKEFSMSGVNKVEKLQPVSHCVAFPHAAPRVNTTWGDIVELEMSVMTGDKLNLVLPDK
jgi:hypothetical protein